MTARRAAIVTGGSRGIGLAIAERLAARGYDLTIAARRPSTLEVAAQRLGPASVLTVATDLADATAPAALVEQHMARFGRLDVLVVNAGTGTVADLDQSSPHRIQRAVDLNVMAPLLLSQRALPLLCKAGQEHANGWIMLLSSITGVQPPRGYATYGATKAALISLARSINVEANKSGVRATALCPAFVHTDMTEWVQQQVPPASMLPASDIAETVDFLLRLSANAVVSELVIGRVGAGLTEP